MLMLHNELAVIIGQCKYKSLLRAGTINSTYYFGLLLRISKTQYPLQIITIHNTYKYFLNNKIIFIFKPLRKVFDIISDKSMIFQV
jgi:hypothetical protein